VGQQPALLGQGVGAGAEARAAIADVTADIEAGPVVHGSRCLGLEGEVCRQACARHEQHAEPKACRGSQQRSATIHRQSGSKSEISHSYQFLQIRLGVADWRRRPTSAAGVPRCGRISPTRTGPNPQTTSPQCSLIAN